jgi:poly-beta-1,6-N-acetyl-D-glucosamine synthase
MESLFWISLTLLFYTYMGYGLLLLLINAGKKKKPPAEDGPLPEVTLVVPAYNEEAVIEEKIQNCLLLDYPAALLHFVFVTDGSTDRTDKIVGRYPQIQLLHQPIRGGKAAAINRAMQEVRTPVVVFTDANTMLNSKSIKKLVRHYRDEAVGGVSGEKRILDKVSSAVGFGERLYWRYESLLKKTNSDFYTIVGAAGELFSIRTKLYQPLEENVILDDFVIWAKVCQQGYRFLYDEAAYAEETPSSSIQEESKRKIRISAGCYQALTRLTGLLNPFLHARVSFQYISHRVLRWTLCPLLLPVLFITNTYLYLDNGSPVYAVFFWCQWAFYALAILGLFFSSRKVLTNSLLVPYYFAFMVWSQYAGFYRFIRRKQTVFWEKANRKTVVT